MEQSGEGDRLRGEEGNKQRRNKREEMLRKRVDRVRQENRCGVWNGTEERNGLVEGREGQNRLTRGIERKKNNIDAKKKKKRRELN